jgi:hypothetical protein
MIPDRLVVFVHGPVVSWVGTRDARLRPTVAWVFGARVLAVTDEIIAFVPDVEVERTKRNLEQNSLVAFTAVQPVTHEAYQFKGKLVEMRPSNDEERAVQDIHRAKLISHFTIFSRELFGGFTLHPSTALTFRVEQIFVQTPGPGAGRLLDLSAEAGA